MEKNEGIFELAVIDIQSEEGIKISSSGSDLIIQGPLDRASAVRDFTNSYKNTHPLYVIKSGDQYFIYS